MAWPNPFRRRATAATRDAWGYVFELSSLHPTLAEMEPMKHSYDVLGERAYVRLRDIRASRRCTSDHHEASPKSAASSTESKIDLYELLKNSTTYDEVLGELWSEVNHVPSWVDWNQLARGQECFYRYGGAALTGLAFHSLIGGLVIVAINTQTY